MENVSRSHHIRKFRMFISDGFSFDPTENIFFFWTFFCCRRRRSDVVLSYSLVGLPSRCEPMRYRWTLFNMHANSLATTTVVFAVHTARTVAACVATLFIELDRRERIRSTLENWIMLISNEREETWKREREKRTRNRLSHCCMKALCAEYGDRLRMQSGEC